jgi:hypothetical protein
MLELKDTDTKSQKAGKKLFNEKVKLLKANIARQKHDILKSKDDPRDRRADENAHVENLFENKKHQLLLEQELSEMLTELLDFIEEYYDDLNT